jgi:hypothetical protein
MLKIVPNNPLSTNTYPSFFVRQVSEEARFPTGKTTIKPPFQNKIPLKVLFSERPSGIPLIPQSHF